MSRVTVVGETDTPVTGIAAAVTVILQVALNPPSAVVTVITADPAATALTRPDAETVAISDELLLHVTFLLFALKGMTAAVS